MKLVTEKYIARGSEYALPSSLKSTFIHVKKLEWITVAYLISVGIVMYLAMGSSQAMKAAWFEDVVSLFPAISFLVASHYYIIINQIIISFLMATTKLLQLLLWQVHLPCWC